MVLTCGQMRDAEEAAFARGATAAGLMEEAGAGIAEVVAQFFPRPGHAVLYLGKGNNAGDALVAARHLLDRGWRIGARTAFGVAEFKELPARHWRSLAGRITLLESAAEVAALRGTVLLLDGLVGVGAEGALRGALADAVAEMNRLRRERQAGVVALDLPSGLDPVTGTPSGACVQADLTITIGQVKDMLLADAATGHVGRLALVPLPELSAAQGDPSRRLLTPEVLRPWLPRRPFDFHKGDAGRVGIVAGSRGYLGAAALCAAGALRGGAGLVTLYAREEVYPLVAPLVPPEVMVRPVTDYRAVPGEKLDALAVGPGLGQAHDAEVFDLMAGFRGPAVIDAEGINLLARRGLGILEDGATRLLTPHPGEMARLAEREPAWKNLDRAALAGAFVQRYPAAVLLLKGARTVIAQSGAPLSFNATGHPGMASGGMGDVLTGLCAALAAQGTGLGASACLGAWLSGRAAEIALRDGGHSGETLAAGDVSAHLGAAFEDLRGGVY